MIYTREHEFVAAFVCGMIHVLTLTRGAHIKIPLNVAREALEIGVTVNGVAGIKHLRTCLSLSLEEALRAYTACKSMAKIENKPVVTFPGFPNP